MKILSASPLRATVKIEQEDSSSADECLSEEEDFARKGLKTLISKYSRERKSPIKDDSEVLRNYGQEFLHSFR